MAGPYVHIQPSFAGGELSPAMWGRIDMAKYAVGARTMRNFFVHPHGSVSNRPGTQYIATAKYSDKKCRLVPFQFSTIQSYVLEFGDHYVRFYMDGGQIIVTDPAAWNSGTAYKVNDYVTYNSVIYRCIQDNTNKQPDINPDYWINQNIYEVWTPYTEADLPYLKFTQSADVLYICHPDHKPKKLSRYGHTNWVLTDIVFVDGPYLTMNTTQTTISASGTKGTVTLTASGDIFQPEHVGALWKIGHYIQAQSAKGKPNEGPLTITAYDSWRLETSGFWKGSFKVERYDEDTATWITLRTLTSSKDRNFSVSPEKLAEQKATTIRVSSIDYVPLIGNSDQDTEGRVLLESIATYYEGWVQITGYTDARHVTAEVRKPLGSTAATTEWAEGAWSDVRGYPACVTFHQDRLVFASTDYEPQTLWMSKVGDYTNFGKTIPVKDDDAVTVQLASRQVNAVRSLIALGDILALTATAEWKIGPATSVATITPTSVAAKVQGYRGASYVDPVLIGNRSIFIQEMGSTVRDLGYSFEQDSYTGDDLSVLARHFFARHQIVDWAYQKEPDSIVWTVRDDGILLGLTYLREHDVWAWHRHDTDGQFESICTIPGLTQNEVWFVVKRGNNRFIERLAERMPTDNVADAFFVDCGLSYNGSPATVLSGLEHLEGKEVAILADGNVMPRQTVTNGQITLPTASSKVHVGLPYTCDLETLNIELASETGSTQGRRKKIPKVTLRLERSRGGWVGPNENHLVELKMRSNEPYGAPIALFSGDKSIEIPGGFNTEGRVFIRQTDPLPITVLAVMAEVLFGG